MEAVLALEKPGESNAVLSNSDQVHHVVGAQPEMEKVPEAAKSQGFDLSELSYELRQAYRVYVELLADSNRNVTWPFLEPVDAKAQGLWDYHERIKEPMSFAKIGSKFNSCLYTSITEVVSDLRLMLENCYRYNGPEHWVSKLGQKLEKVLEQKLALLNRSLREKVTLTATMALRLNCDVETLNEGLGRRRTGRSYVNMLNGDSSSSIISHLKIQEEFEERERRIQKEKEKKEANEALLLELAEWEVKELTPDVVKQLHSMWEIPSVVSLLYILKDFLDLQDINLTELEISFVYPNKSKLLSKVFTALLVTPHQRKSLTKKQPMVFKVWEAKLADRVSSWYRVVEVEGPEMAAYRFGLDPEFYNILGDSNPLVEKAYYQLSLHRRVWLLKCLCDNSVFKDNDIREQLGGLVSTDQREWVLGYDADNWSYLYFPVFESTDLRVYRQCPLPNPPFSDKKWEVSPAPSSPAPARVKKTPSRPATPTQAPRSARLRKLRKSPSPDPEPCPPQEEAEPQKEDIEEDMEVEEECTIAPGFEVACCDVESLRALCQKLDKQAPPPPKKRGRKPKAPPSRKRCEVELQLALVALLDELEQHDARFAKAASRAKAKVMKESQEPDPPDKSEEKPPSEEEDEDWVSEGSIEEIPLDTSDEEFVLEEEQMEYSVAQAKKTLPQEIVTTPDQAITMDNLASRKRKLDEGAEQKLLGTGQSILGHEQRLLATGQSITGPTIVKAGQTFPGTGQTFPGSRQTFPGNSQKLPTPVNNVVDSSCEIAIQTPPLKLKKKHKSPSNALVSIATTMGTQASSAVAKLVTAVPPTVNRAAVVGGATAAALQVTKPLPNTQAKVATQPGGVLPGSAAAGQGPAAMLKHLVPGNARQILVVAPGRMRQLQPKPEGAQSQASSAGTAAPTATSATGVVLKNLAPAINSPQTLVVAPSNAKSGATTVKVLPYQVAASGSLSSTSQTPSIISLPPGLLSQQALQGSTTQVVIGGKVVTAIAVRGSQIAPGQHITRVLSPASCAKASSSAVTKVEPTPKTRPLILASARSRQTPAVQLAHPVAVATAGSSTVVVTSLGTSSSSVASTISSGASTIPSGASSLSVGASTIYSVASTIPSGASSLSVGASTISSGISVSSSAASTAFSEGSTTSSVSSVASSSPLGAPSPTSTSKNASGPTGQPVAHSADSTNPVVDATILETSVNHSPNVPLMRPSVPVSGFPSSSVANQPTSEMWTVSGAVSSSMRPNSLPKAPIEADVIPTSRPSSSLIPNQTVAAQVPGAGTTSSPSLSAALHVKTPVGTHVSEPRPSDQSTLKQVPGQSSTQIIPLSTSTVQRVVNGHCPFTPGPLNTSASTTSGVQQGVTSSSSVSLSSSITQPIPDQGSHQSCAKSAAVSSGSQVGPISLCSSTSKPIPNQDSHQACATSAAVSSESQVSPISLCSSTSKPSPDQAFHQSCAMSAVSSACVISGSRVDAISLSSSIPRPLPERASSQGSEKSLVCSASPQEAQVDFISPSLGTLPDPEHALDPSRAEPLVSTTGITSEPLEDYVSSSSNPLYGAKEMNDRPSYLPGGFSRSSGKTASENGRDEMSSAEVVTTSTTAKHTSAELGSRESTDESPKVGGARSAGFEPDVTKARNSADVSAKVKSEAGIISSDELHVNKESNESVSTTADDPGLCNGVTNSNERTSFLPQDAIRADQDNTT